MSGLIRSEAEDLEACARRRARADARIAGSQCGAEHLASGAGAAAILDRLRTRHS
jgi:hypothetical protein